MEDNNYEREPLDEAADGAKQLAGDVTRHAANKIKNKIAANKNNQPNNAENFSSKPTSNESLSQKEANSFADEVAKDSSSAAKKAAEDNISKQATAQVQQQAAQAATKQIASTTAAATGAGAAAGAVAANTATSASAGAAAAEAGAAAGGAAAGGSSGAAAGAAGGPVGWIVAAAVAVLGAGAKLAKKDSETLTGDSDNGLGTILLVFGGLLLGLAFMVAILFGPIFGIVATVYNSFNTVKEAVMAIPAYFEEQKKESFFEELFETKEVDGIITATRVANEDAMEVYKDIIDYSIYLALNDYCQDLFWGFKTNISFMKEGYSAGTTYSKLRAQPYPYALQKDYSGTNYYTVSDFIKDYKKDKDKRSINNDDLNYAEIFAVLEQNTAFDYDAFTYSDFYDLLVNQNTTSLLIEVEVGDMVYIKKEGLSSKDTDDFLSDEEIDDNNANMEESEEKDEDAPGFWDKVFGTYDVHVWPAGLMELYGIAGDSPYNAHKYVDAKPNWQLLDYSELWVRKMFPTVNLGPSFEDSRSVRSLVYSKLQDQYPGITPTGRSAYSYCENYIAEEIHGITYKQTYCDDRIQLSTKYVPTGSSYILDMFGYINQLKYDESLKRGKWDGTGTDERTSIHDKGCIDCCYVMVYEYFYRNPLNVPLVCENYVNSVGDFERSTFTSAYHFSEKENYTYNADTIRSELAEGAPVVMYMYGKWEYNGITYKKSENTGHFIVIMGYDDNGFYVYDPANENTTENGPIPYEAFRYALSKKIFCFNIPAECTVRYKVSKYEKDD